MIPFPLLFFRKLKSFSGLESMFSPACSIRLAQKKRCLRCKGARREAERRCAAASDTARADFESRKEEE